MNKTMPAPANLEDGYLLYLAALRETGTASLFDTRVSQDAQIEVICRETWAFVDRQPQP